MKDPIKKLACYDFYKHVAAEPIPGRPLVVRTEDMTKTTGLESSYAFADGSAALLDAPEKGTPYIMLFKKHQELVDYLVENAIICGINITPETAMNALNL